MTTATEQILTPAERFELAFRDMWALIADNNLPPAHVTINPFDDHVSITAHLPSPVDLELWADAASGEPVPTYDGYLSVACTVIGHSGTRLRLTAITKKL